MEELFIRIEEIIADSSSLEELKKKKLEYINNHRLVLHYFNQLQNEIEEGN